MRVVTFNVLGPANPGWDRRKEVSAAGEAPELPGCPELLAALRARLGRLDDQMHRLAQSRDALANYIAAAERVGNDTYPPFDDAGLEAVAA